MSVTDGGECNKGSAVMSGGGGAFWVVEELVKGIVERG